MQLRVQPLELLAWACPCLDVALEALRDYLRSKRRSVDALMKAAAASRVTNLMRPYLESLS